MMKAVGKEINVHDSHSILTSGECVLSVLVNNCVQFHFIIAFIHCSF